MPHYPMTKVRYDSLTAAGERPERVEYLQCAGLLQDVRTGAVLAMLGGRDFADSRWNNSWQALRQPGSVFKPIVYLTALQHGYHPASILLDTPFVVDTGSSLWRPKNFSNRFQGPVTLRYALSHSINTPTAKMYLDFGLQPVVDNARRLGITQPLPRVPALFLGAGEVTLREMVGVFATFANHGVRVEQHLITRVETLDGEVLEQTRIRQHEVLDPAEAYLITDLLQTALRQGTGQSARWRGFTKSGAGKTGTTNESTNAWFCGYTPSFCAGVWVGFEELQPMGRNATGARQALPIWARFMGKIADEKGEEPFVRPPAIVEQRVCLVSGLLATSACDSTALEVFLPTTYPQSDCDVHGAELHDRSEARAGFRHRSTARPAATASEAGHDDARWPDGSRPSRPGAQGRRRGSGRGRHGRRHDAIRRPPRAARSAVPGPATAAAPAVGRASTRSPVLASQSMPTVWSIASSTWSLAPPRSASARPMARQSTHLEPARRRRGRTPRRPAAITRPRSSRSQASRPSWAAIQACSAPPGRTVAQTARTCQGRLVVGRQAGRVHHGGGQFLGDRTRSAGALSRPPGRRAARASSVSLAWPTATPSGWDMSVKRMAMRRPWARRPPPARRPARGRARGRS
jgi:membrane peptidoglycan carboxypeptidase